MAFRPSNDLYNKLKEYIKFQLKVINNISSLEVKTIEDVKITEDKINEAMGTILAVAINDFVRDAINEFVENATIPLADDVKTFEDGFKSWIPVPMDGGASLKTLLSTILSSLKNSNKIKI